MQKRYKNKRKSLPKFVDNLQTVIVSKEVAPTRAKARKIAKEYARRIYTSRETSKSWRFRQRPPEDFEEGTFRTFKVPNQGVSLVYGKLKNPDGRKIAKDLRVYDYYLDQVNNARDIEELSIAASMGHAEIRSNALKDQLDYYIAEKSAQLGKRFKGNIFEISEKVRSFGQQELFENPLKTMPDPGPCAWLGSLIEFKWKSNKEKLWECKKQNWLFLWSPKLKAIVGIKQPDKMKLCPDVSRKGGAAKIAERFKARSAQDTYEIDIPKTKLKKLGKAIHIVYRSDKWNPGKNVDYIHEFKDGVVLYCGPDSKNPELFLAKGGKLTVTERGLVF